MTFGAVGDLHGDFEALDRIMARHPDIDFWVCPGDLADSAGQYPHPISPLYWIFGNNEDFDFVAVQPPGGGTIQNLHYIPNGIGVETAGARLAGLGGTFAPTWYETSRPDLPSRAGKRRIAAAAERPSARAHAGSADDKRRHFVHEDVAACAALAGIVVFLSHEAARPFVLHVPSSTGSPRRVDAGKTPVNEVLAAMQPRLHLFGHHHKYIVAERNGVPSIGLEKVSEGYLIFDGKTLAHERLTV